MMTAWTTKNTNNFKLEKIGLSPGHAYTVLGILEINSKQIIKLRNSWVNFEFIGDWSEWNYRYDQIIKEKITDIELLLIPKLF